MKKSLVIALLMVLVLSVSAFAADVKFSGKVWYNWSAADSFGNGYRFQWDGSLDANSGFQVRLEPGTIDVDEVSGDANVSKVAVGALVKRANYWVNTPFGKVRVGQQYTNFSALDVNFTGSELAEGYTGISVSPTLGEGISATAFVAPVNTALGHKFGVQGSYDLKVAKVYGGFDKTGDADMNWAIGASAPVLDKFLVYGEIDKTGDADAVKYIGGKASVAGFDAYVEYGVDAKDFAVDVYKTVKNVEFNYTFEKVDEADATHYIGTTLYF